jgi:hypothetical protein
LRKEAIFISQTPSACIVHVQPRDILLQRTVQ